MEQDILEPGFVYHIFNRGNNKETIFKEPKNYEYFLNRVFFHLRSNCDIYAYCLMPNHFHLLLRIKDDPSSSSELISKIHQPFSNLFNSYTKSINKQYSRSGSLFQKHMHRERVIDDNYLRKAFIYIHTNPVHHGFVKDYMDYEWSSVHDYFTKPSGNLNMELPLLLFDGLENMASEHKRKNNFILGIFDEDV